MADRAEEQPLQVPEGADELYGRLLVADADDTPRWEPIPDKHLAKVVSVYDGDTVTLLASFAGSLARCSMRIRGIDCPEMRGRGADERHAAEMIRDLVRTKYLNRVCRVHSNGTDKYGRLIGDLQIFSEGPFLAGYLLEKGLAREYAGGTRQPFTAAELAKITATCAALQEAADGRSSEEENKDAAAGAVRS